MKTKLMITAAMLLAATPAFAQEEQSTPDSGLSGFSIAVIGGLDVLTIQENNQADADRNVMFGGSIGYDHQVGKVVVGVQAEITKSQATYVIEDLLVNGDRFSSDAGRDIYAGVRVGLPTGTRSMVYIGGGYVSSQLTSVYTDNSGTIEETEDRAGFRVSLGFEGGAGKNFFYRAEMRYQDLGDYTVFTQPTGFARTNTQFVVGAGLRF